MPTPPRRRWFQVSIRTLLAIVAALAIWLAYGLNWVKSREETSQYLKANGVAVYPPGMSGTEIRPWRDLPLTLRLLRAEPVGRIVIPFSSSFLSRSDIERVEALFPEASVTQ